MSAIWLGVQLGLAAGLARICQAESQASPVTEDLKESIQAFRARAMGAEIELQRASWAGRTRWFVRVR
jgi:hypothetical protein